jgi:hypothetical protein
LRVAGRVERLHGDGTDVEARAALRGLGHAFAVFAADYLRPCKFWVC